MQQYTFRKMVQIAEANGYAYIRCSGDHYIYKKEGESKQLVLVKNKQMNPCIARRLIKEHHLIIIE